MLLWDLLLYLCFNMLYIFGLIGYMIPKGWKIYVYTREINYDPCLFPDPYTFNPWRWLVSPYTSCISCCYSIFISREQNIE